MVIFLNAQVESLEDIFNNNSFMVHVNTFSGKESWMGSFLASLGPVEGLHSMRKCFCWISFLPTFTIHCSLILIRQAENKTGTGKSLEACVY